MYKNIQSYSAIWKNIEYNIGSAFDASNGKFTCPYDGIYSFYATSAIYNQHDGHIDIYVNGSLKIHHYLYNHGAGRYEYKHVSPQGVFKLRKGDTVHIHMHGTYYYASSEWIRTYFQGHLIDLL